jgi:CheY-like chemotaxis protein
MCVPPEPRRVLVVDDSDDVREALADILTDAGYAVEQAADGRGALARLGQLPQPCLVFLDVHMPVMGGVELLRALGARLERLPVVVISGHAQEAQGLGARKCVPKPVSLTKVLALAEEFCDA